MSTSEIGVWEKSILTKLGLCSTADASTFGTHSAKATLLSWAAKADLSPHHRRLLGAHVDREEQSMLTYARDAMAGPLQKLGIVFAAVRERRFLPDVSRSGRWGPAQYGDLSAQKAAPQGVLAIQAMGEDSGAENPSRPEGGSAHAGGAPEGIATPVDQGEGDAAKPASVSSKEDVDTGSRSWAKVEDPGSPPAADASVASVEETSEGEEPVCAACGLTCPFDLTVCTGCLLAFHSDPPCMADCARCSVSFCARCRAPAAHKCTGVPTAESEASGDGDTDRPSDQEEADEEAEVDKTAVALAASAKPLSQTPVFPSAGLVRHWRHRTIHIRGSDEVGTQTACGFNFLVADYEALDAWPSVAWPLCRRAKCFGACLG